MKKNCWTARIAIPMIAIALAAAPAAAAELPDPGAVRGVYLTAWNAANPSKMAEILSLIDRTELNAVVVDVKADSGVITITTDEATASAAGAVDPYIADPQAFIRGLHDRGIYAIARIVAFKDPIVAAAHPEWAVKREDGSLWRDYSGVAWLDPYNREAWDYVLRIARAAARAGFDEIQFDYVRFPSDGDMSSIVYPAEDGRAPQQVIADFLAYAREDLKAHGVLVSADVFGLVTSFRDDMGIGQHLEEIAAAVDFVSPMLYPSHYEAWNLGLPNPEAMPYETVLRSLQDASARIEAAGLAGAANVRPWLQDFSWNIAYGPAEVRAQIQATLDAGYTGWMLWNPANVYTEAALLPPAAPVPGYVLPAAEVGDEVTVVVNGEPLVFEDARPFIARSTGRTLVPVRPVAVALGAAVEYDEAARTVTVRLRDRTVQLTLGEDRALVNGTPVELNQKGVIWQNRTLVPVRFLTEALGCQVDWDPDTRTVYVLMG